MKANKPLVVGIIGRPKHGKTTVAEIVREHFMEIDVQVFSFATALKIELFDWIQGLGLIHKHFDGFDGAYQLPIPSTGVDFSAENKVKWIDAFKDKFRPFLQKWGTEFRRVQDDKYWVEKVDYEITYDDPAVAILPDTRFPNEVAICDVIVKSVREGFVDDPSVLVHESEQALKDVVPDYTISVPDGNLGQLQSEAVRVFTQIFKKHNVIPANG